MNFDFIKIGFKKGKEEYFAKGLYAVSLALAAVLVLKVTAFGIVSVRIPARIKNTIENSKQDEEAVKKRLEKYTAIAGELKKKNPFVPPPPNDHPVKEVSGIMGKEVLIKGTFYKVGDKIGDAEIVAIGPTFVKIKWNGKEKTFAPIGAADKPGAKKKPQPEKKKMEKKENTVQQTEKPKEEVPVAVEDEDPLAWMGVTLSAKARAMILQVWNNASDEQKEEMKERWNSMSDEEKQQALDQWNNM